MLRVMLVDDEPIIKAAFRKIIPWEDEGFEIIGTASHGQEALALLARCPADLIITDLKMPHMDGIALIKALKRQRFDGVILVLSNYADFDLVREALVAGAMDYMLKVGIDAQALRAQLSRVRETVATQRKHQQREELVSAHSALVRAHALRTYLLPGPEAAAEDALPAALQELGGQGPFHACRVVFLPPARGAASRMPSAQHVETVLRSVYEGVRDAAIFSCGERALLLVYPARALAERNMRHSDKLRQIIRQIGMYFNASVLVIDAAPATDLPGVRAAQGAMDRAALLSFYALPAQCLAAEAVAFQPAVGAESPEDGARRLAETYFAQGIRAAAEYLAALLDGCREKRVHPRALCAYVAQVGRHLGAYAPPDGQAEAPVQKPLPAAPFRDEHELYAQALARFEAVLGQIVPPLYADCRAEVRKALLFVHTHYCSHITLDDVARETSLDRSYLCRLFKRETGTSLFSYMNALRMDAAARLIREGDAYVRDVSARVGIDDPFYFTRLFKKRFGVSPRAYREGAGPRSGGKAAPG